MKNGLGLAHGLGAKLTPLHITLKHHNYTKRLIKMVFLKMLSKFN